MNLIQNNMNKLKKLCNLNIYEFLQSNPLLQMLFGQCGHVIPGFRKMRYTCVRYILQPCCT